jgi:predicted RNA-binding protein with PIN domain
MSQAKMIVDGYNLLLAGKGLMPQDSLAQGRDQVIRQLVSYSSMKKIKVVVVFDGRENMQKQTLLLPASLQVQFSRPPENADAVIKRMVEKEKQPARHMIVVTSDQAIARYVKSCGCQHWTTVMFQQKMVELYKSPAYEDKYRQSVSPGELEEWLNLFGADRE